MLCATASKNLIEIQQEINLSPYVGTVCLPDTNNKTLALEKLDQQDCFGMGWGKDKLGKSNRCHQLETSFNRASAIFNELGKNYFHSKVGFESKNL